MLTSAVLERQVGEGGGTSKEERVTKSSGGKWEDEGRKWKEDKGERWRQKKKEVRSQRVSQRRRTKTEVREGR